MDATPNGAKIYELRLSKGLPQKTLADKSQMSERLLRDIEKKNKRIAQFRINNLANALGVEPSVITQSHQPGRSSLIAPARDNPREVELVSISTGRDLYSVCQYCDKLEWFFYIEPTLETAKLIEELLTIVNRTIYGPGGGRTDQYDENSLFPVIFRVAKLGSLIKDLNNHSINVLANFYFYRDKTSDEEEVESHYYTRIDFCDASVKSKIVIVYRGSYFIGKDGYDLDDEIPF